MARSTRVGPYRVLRLINKGGQGGVYLGYDDRLHRRVAIKIHRLPDDPAGRKRALSEARLVAGLQSSKIVPIYDLVVAEENIALIMEYVPGCDLEDFLRGCRPSVPGVLTVATDIAGALAAARQQKIVHGDLKARNVLVTAGGRVKLTDFGIARAQGDMTPGALRAGTPSCVSPEQFQGLPLDVRSDLFALGCLLYRMLTGLQPFIVNGQLDPHRLLQEMPAGVETINNDLPAGLPELIDSLLQKKPEDRPGGTQQVRFALRDIARSLPLSVSSKLLEEALPSFRQEAPDDVPPRVPADLRRGGHSRLRPFQADDLSSWRAAAARIGAPRLSALLGAVTVLAIIAVRTGLPGETRLHIEAPDIHLAPGVRLPAELSPLWLIDQVTAAAAEQLGPVVVTGPIADRRNRIRYAESSRPVPGEPLSLALRCSAQFCLFTIARGGGDREQVVLFPDMALPAWREAVRSAAGDLFGRD